MAFEVRPSSSRGWSRLLPACPPYEFRLNGIGVIHVHAGMRGGNQRCLHAVTFGCEECLACRLDLGLGHHGHDDTSSSRTPLQGAEPVGGYFDHIAGAKPFRRVETRPAPVGVPHTNIPGRKRRECRHVTDDLREAENHPTCPVLLPQLAIHPCRQLDVRQHLGSGETKKRRPMAAERSQFLPCVTLNFACLTQSRMVPSLQRVTADMVPVPGPQRRGGPPDNNRNLALIISCSSSGGRTRSSP